MNTLRTVLKRVFFAVIRCLIITPVISLVRLRSRLRDSGTTSNFVGLNGLHLTPVFFYTRTRALAHVRVSAARMRAATRGIQAFAAIALLAITVVAAVAGSIAPANAAASDVINFQARLETPSGAIVSDGDYNVQFKLYSVSTGGSALWTESYLNTASQGVHVVNGYLTVNLGSITSFPSNIPWDQQLYLTMNIGGTSSSGSPTYDGEMSPRLQLTAVPYAFQAKNATQLQATNGANVATLTFTPPTANNSIVLPDLPAGTYRFSAWMFNGAATLIHWVDFRQIAVFEF